MRNFVQHKFKKKLVFDILILSNTGCAHFTSVGKMTLGLTE